MNYNESLFNCSYYINNKIENPCELKLAYARNNFIIVFLTIISFLGLILNLIFIILRFLRKKRGTNRKVLMRRLFLIFPFTDLLTSIYWIFSVFYFDTLEKIKNNITLCSLNSVYYLFLLTFQFILINILLFHFRKINKNPLDAIFNPNRKLILYLIICFVSGIIVSMLSESLQTIGISPMNTCFISIKGGINNIILLIPLLCVIMALAQLTRDLFCIYMFNSDKVIHNIYKKNSLYVFIFCLLHIPLILVFTFSLIVGKNYFELKENLIVEYFIKISTIITGLVPFVMSILRQIQGLTRLECFHNYVKKNKLKNVRMTIEKSRKPSLSNKENISIDLDPFEWLENHIMENLMRDILLGIAISIKSSEVYYNDYIDDKMEFNQKNFEEDKTHEINFKNFGKYGVNDFTVEGSDFLNFKVIEYAPKCFYYLRKLEKINIKKMVESFLPKNNNQRINKSLGKSGSFFISTDDNKYMIKTLKSDELELLRHAFLKKYINHIEQYPKSLLCRLYGIYNIILGQGDQILIIVMRNVIGDFKDNTIVKFDLKGSTYKRKANFQMENDNNVMKDLDFMEFEKSIILSEISIDKLRNMSKIDSNFLKDNELMDYSLFLVKLTFQIKEFEDVFGEDIRERQKYDFKKMISNDDLKEEKEKEKENNNINNQRDWRFASYRGAGKSNDIEHYRQYLFPSLNQGTGYIIAIIDYFQYFNFFKYMESAVKNGLHRKNTISCVDPITYSIRFIKNIELLTDVKKLLSVEIKEKISEDKLDENIDEDDKENILNRYQKKQENLIRMSQLINENQLLISNENEISV